MHFRFWACVVTTLYRFKEFFKQKYNPSWDPFTFHCHISIVLHGSISAYRLYLLFCTNMLRLVSVDRKERGRGRGIGRGREEKRCSDWHSSGWHEVTDIVPSRQSGAAFNFGLTDAARGGPGEGHTQCS